VKSSGGQKKVWAIAEELLPRGGKATWTHNQAIMELGALVCTARVARCGECPVRAHCMTGNRERETGRKARDGRRRTG
jgi:A/G-specific adenine glycosylase